MAGRDSNGNPQGGGRRTAGELAERVYWDMFELDRRLETWLDQGWTLRYIRVKAPDEVKPNWLVVVAITTPEGAFVSFTDGTDLPGTMHVAVAKCLNGSAKWVEDRYAGK